MGGEGAAAFIGLPRNQWAVFLLHNPEGFVPCALEGQAALGWIDEGRFLFSENPWDP